MHGILPSEIARLVLDYLETSSCPEAARVFLETSPDLQECRRVAASGGKFITRVFGLTLINILYTFCDIYGLVQERLTKINADERLRRCNDLCEQLRTLIDDCRGQRFFVNINVPAQSTNNNINNNNNNNNATGSSPIITSSIRKRRHSGPANKEKCNRSSKSHSLPVNEIINSPPINLNHCDANKIKALSLSSSAAASDVAVDPLVMTKPAVNFKELQSSSLLCEKTPVQCSSTVGETNNGVQSSTSSPSQDYNEKNKQLLTKVDNSCTKNNEKLSIEKDNLTPKKLSTGTDTQELMKYSTAEVQTIPYDIMEFESEATDEPIENLSLLTKELLNRTELQERIADNINKAILPTDGLSLKDLSFSECIAANDCNTSIMTELNNAIKSIVTATEKDPVFERFFDEIFQADIEGEQSQDDDARQNIIHSNESLNDASPETMDECPTESQNNIINDNLSNDKNSQLNVPSKIVEVNAEFANDPTPKIDATDNQALEDVNAAAVMSIINANHKLSEKIVMETETSPEKPLNDPKYDFPITNIADGINNPSIPDVNFKQNDQQIILQGKNSEIISVENNSSTLTKKSGRKSRITKPKQKPIPAETVIPTLIVCNKNDINITSTALPLRLMNNIESENNINDGQKSQYVPIAPKNPSGSVPSTTTLYLRAVNVAKQISTTNTNKQNVDEKMNDKIIQNNVATIEKKSTTEAITLYGISENNLTEVLEPTSLPTINIDDPVSFSDSGLSPFLKFNKKSIQPTIPNEQIVNNNPGDNIISRITDCDITKRTPKSLLKSRSMNHRLSLSTPRRRSGHIRALDFSTPPKEINTSRRLSEADACPYQIKSINNSKSVCRTSLFKTPPFENSPIDKQKNSRCVRSMKTPSADSSPVPKLYGGWDKVSGVGTILGCGSPTVSSLISSSSSTSISKNNSAIKKSWDADLRESLEINDNDEKPREKLRKRNGKINVKGVKSSQVLSKNNSIDIKKSEILINETNQNKLTPINEVNNSICDIKVLKTNLTTETVTINNKVITKKYAKLKTLATNIKRIDNNEQNNLSNITNTSSELSEKSGELIKANSQNLSNIAIDLETPRKNDNTLGVPPTPRVLSPNSSTPFIQVTEDTGKVRCFITTPEFPPTPCINLTPRQTLENTTDVINNEFSAPYYHPSSELKDNLITQSQNEQISSKTNKPEITQFEVIKENLPKDEACKELNISINSKDPEPLKSMKKNISTDKKDNCNDLIKTNKSSEISGITLSDSSNSESDTSSSSCSSSSSSCSCNGDTTNNSSRMSTSRRSKVKDTASKSDDFNSSITKLIPKINNKETSDDKSVNSCEQIERQIARVISLDQQEMVANRGNDLWTKNELSPEKVIPINKTQQALDEADTETPAKDEALLCEAEISETPSGSKCGFETLTNLTSKISALIGANKESNSRKYHSVLRKLDAKLSADSVKTNILVSFDNVEGSSRLGKDRLTNKGTIDVTNESNNILAQQNSDKLRGNSDKIKTVDVPDAEESILRQRLKCTLQTREQTALRKSRKEIQNIIPKDDKNEEEEKIMDNKSEIAKTNPMDLIEPATDLPDKLLIDDAIIAVNSPQEEKSLIAPGTSKLQIPSTADEKIVTSPTKNAKTELSVLESLKLVPANKIDIVEDPEVNSTKLMHNCHREFSFIHDDTVNTRKKNIKKFSPSDLEFTIQLRNDEFVTMTATKFEILFTLPSKSVRSRSTRKFKPEVQPEPKPPMKPTIRSIKTVKGITITKNKKLAQVSTVVSQPLATSSPVQIETAPKVSGKIKSTNDNADDLIMNKGKNVKQDNNKKQSMTTRKRKERSESKDDEPAEKKTAVINPKLLLSRVNIDEFLSAVHGPITKS